MMENAMPGKRKLTEQHKKNIGLSLKGRVAWNKGKTMWGKRSTKDKLAISKGHQPKYGESNFNFVYGLYKYSAKQRSLLWDISKEDFRKLTTSNCFYCNCKPKNIHTRCNRVEWGKYPYNGLDRIDNAKGYTTDNVVPCCAMCNRMRMAWSQEEFLSKIKEIYEYLKLGE